MNRIVILALALGFMTNDQVWGNGCTLNIWNPATKQNSTLLSNNEVSKEGLTLCLNNDPIACSTTLINESNTKAEGSAYKCTAEGKWELLTTDGNGEDPIKSNKNKTTTTLSCKNMPKTTHVCFKTTEQGKTKPLHEKITCESSRHYKCDFHTGMWSAVTH